MLYEERGFHAPYFQAKFMDQLDRSRRSSDALSNTVLDYMDGAEETQWGLTYETFMRHLSYQCDACYGPPAISDTCDRIVSSTCKEETCVICDGQHTDCVNTCDGWSPAKRDSSNETPEATQTTTPGNNNVLSNATQAPAIIVILFLCIYSTF